MFKQKYLTNKKGLLRNQFLQIEQFPKKKTDLWVLECKHFYNLHIFIVFIIENKSLAESNSQSNWPLYLLRQIGRFDLTNPWLLHYNRQQ